MKRAMYVTLVMMNIAVGIVGAAMAALPATPPVIPFQGRLTDAAGNPINAAQDLTFKIYTVATGGAAQFTEAQKGVTAADGLFSVQIGSATGGGVPGFIFTGGDLYLGITVGTDPEMTPRQRLGSVPYAMRAGIVPAMSLGRFDDRVDFPTGATFGDMTATTVTIPTAGTILVTAQGQVGMSGAAAASLYGEFQIDETAGGGEDATHYNVAGFTSYPGGVVWMPVSIMRAYSKPAGTYTFRLEARQIVGTGHYFWQPTITALFFPDQVGGVTLAPTAPGTATNVKSRGVGGAKLSDE